LPSQLREDIARLRLEGGLSLGAISDALGVPKSTVQYIVGGLKLTKDALVRLRLMRRQAAEQRKVFLAEHGRTYGLHYWVDADHRAAAAQRARETNLRYRDGELPVRRALQDLHDCEFYKEAFDGVVLKACSQTLVIDWALTKATCHKLPARMAVVKSLEDPRQRLAYLPRRYLESVAAARLRKLRVKVHAVEDVLPLTS